MQHHRRSRHDVSEHHGAILKNILLTAPRHSFSRIHMLHGAVLRLFPRPYVLLLNSADKPSSPPPAASPSYFPTMLSAFGPSSLLCTRPRRFQAEPDDSDDETKPHHESRLARSDIFSSK